MADLESDTQLLLHIKIDMLCSPQSGRSEYELHGIRERSEAPDQYCSFLCAALYERSTHGYKLGYMTCNRSGGPTRFNTAPRSCGLLNSAPRRREGEPDASGTTDR